MTYGNLPHVWKECGRQPSYRGWKIIGPVLGNRVDPRGVALAQARRVVGRLGLALLRSTGVVTLS